MARLKMKKKDRLDKWMEKQAEFNLRAMFFLGVLVTVCLAWHLLAKHLEPKPTVESIELRSYQPDYFDRQNEKMEEGRHV
jgi:hypothetical protein